MSAITQQLMSYGVTEVDPFAADVFGFWPFQADLEDYSGNNYDFGPTGGSIAVTTTVPMNTASLEFNGTTQYASRANTVEARLDYAEYTGDGYIHMPTLDQGWIIGQRHPVSGNGWTFWSMADGSCFVQGTAGTPNNMSTAAGVLSAGVTHHWEFSQEDLGGGDWIKRLWIDGVMRVKHTSAGGGMTIATDTASAFVMGVRVSTPDNYWDGHAAWFRMTAACRHPSDSNFTPPPIPFPYP